MLTAMESVTTAATARDSWTLTAMVYAITTADVDAVDADAAAMATLSTRMVMASATISASTAGTLTATASRTDRTTIMSHREMDADRVNAVIDKSVLCAWNDRALFLFFKDQKSFEH